ncbi:MAG TPA: PKD domain-containing protein [Pirellulaceae bacterium]|nr:PKD domain-containing protein [Pirellulaceae bacterium]
MRWNASGDGSPLDVPAENGDLPTGAALASSADGKVVVGRAERYANGVPLGTSPMRWTADGSFTDLAEFEPNGQGKRQAEARDVSADGTVLCGFASRYALSPPYGQVAKDAVRWGVAGAATVLRSPGDSSGAPVADAIVVSGDGTTIGGFARKFAGDVSQGDRPVVWSADGVVTELPVLEASAGGFASGQVTSLSFDDSRAFGTVKRYDPNGALLGTSAVRWSGGAPQVIGPGDLFGSLPPAAPVGVIGCSESGSRAAGFAETASGPRGFVWTEGQGTVDLGTLYPSGSAFVGTCSPSAISADGSTVVGRSTDGSFRQAFVWRDGRMRSLREVVLAAGVDLAAERWEAFSDAVACSSDGSVIVGVGTRNGKAVGFRVKINDRPTVAAPTPIYLECTGGQNLVELAATASDANSGDRLTVIWKVDGATLQTTPNIVPGKVVKFLGDYSDGPHTVSLEVTDGYLTASASTTVTVVDTTAPSIVVAPDVVLATDPGKAHATGVQLTPPSVVDLCDGDPRLTHDGPLVFPLGRTTVTWRAEDDDGNVSTAPQRVIVVDQEKPRIAGPRDAVVRCDRGQTFATMQLPPAQATDNVPQGLKVTWTAPGRFPIGVSTASWTATDAAGNQATWSTKVTVINQPPAANAGKNVTVIAKSERGAKVTLSGSRSSDPDGHSLSYRWSAPGVRFAGPTKAKTTANFPVGSKTVKLTVTDEAGAKKVDSVRVTVKLKNAKRRRRGAASNAEFAEALRASSASLSGRTPDASAASGLLHAAAAHRMGIELGDHVRWEEGESEGVALLRYAERRELQRRYGQVAARRFLASFLETGDEAVLLAGVHAMQGVAHAAEDLVER